MEAAGALAAEHPDLHVQTHPSENRAEIDFACSLYPEAKDYTDIYARYGLLGPKSLMGHCVHLSERELGAMAEARAVAVFNPTSNLFLGSGLFDMARVEGLGCAHGGGDGRGRGDEPGRCSTPSTRPTRSSPCPVPEPAAADVLLPRDLGQRPGAGARRTGSAGSRRGTTRISVVLDIHGAPAMSLRAERVQTLAEEPVRAPDHGRRPGGGGGLCGGVASRPQG